MKNKVLAASFIVSSVVFLFLGVLAGYIWGGWHEWEKGYSFAVRQICTGEVETVKANKQALLMYGETEK